MIVKSGWLGRVAVSGLMVFSPGVFAQCMKAVLAPGKTGYSVCKEWPAQAGLEIAAEATTESDAIADDRVGRYDLYVAVLDSATQRVMASLEQKNAITSDAIAFYDLAVDTARYQLTADLRAFGIRSRFSHESVYSPVANENLSLFVVEGNTLRVVLSDLPIAHFHGVGGSECQNAFTTTTRTLEIGQGRRHGFADIVVRTSTSERVDVQDGERCLEKTSKPKLTRTTSHYDGTRYVVPEALKGI